MQLLILLPILSQLFYVTKSERVSHEVVANYTCLGSFQSKLAANSNSVAHIFAYFESTHPNYTCIGSFQSKLAANFNAVAHIIAYFETTVLCDQIRESFP